MRKVINNEFQGGLEPEHDECERKNEQKKMNNEFQGGLEPEPLPLMDLCRRVIRQQVGLSIFKLFCSPLTFSFTFKLFLKLFSSHKPAAHINFHFFLKINVTFQT